MIFIEAIGCGLLLVGVLVIVHAFSKKSAPMGEAVAEFLVGYSIAGLGAALLVLRFTIWFFGRWFTGSN